LIAADGLRGRPPGFARQMSMRMLSVYTLIISTIISGGKIP